MKVEIDSLKAKEEMYEDHVKNSSGELEQSKTEIEEVKRPFEESHRKNKKLEESIRNLEEQKKSSASEDENRTGTSKEVELEGIISNQAAELVFFKDKISQLEALQASSPSESEEKSSVDTEDLKKKLSEAEGKNKKLKVEKDQIREEIQIRQDKLEAVKKVDEEKQTEEKTEDQSEDKENNASYNLVSALEQELRIVSRINYGFPADRVSF